MQYNRALVRRSERAFDEQSPDRVRGRREALMATRTTVNGRLLFPCAILLSVAAATWGRAGERQIITRRGFGDEPTHLRDLTRLERNLLFEMDRPTDSSELVLGFLLSRGNDATGAAVVKCKARSEVRYYFGDTYDRYYARAMSNREVERFEEDLRNIDPAGLSGTGNEIRTRQGVISFVGGELPSAGLFFRFSKSQGVRVAFNRHIVSADGRMTAKEKMRYNELMALFLSLRKSTASWKAAYPSRHWNSDFKMVFGHPDYHVLRVWMDEGRLGCLAAKRSLTAPSDHRQSVWIRGGHFGRAATTPVSLRDVPEWRTIDGISLSPVRSSSDGRWTVGLAREALTLACYDHANHRFLDLDDDLKQGQWFPVYYCDYRHEFVLVRLRSDSLRKEHYLLGLSDYAFKRDIVDVRLYNPAGIGRFPKWNNLDRNVKYRIQHSGDFWFQWLPRRLQQRSADGRHVWMAVPASEGTSIVAFDLEEWLYDQPYAGISVRVQADAVWVSEPKRRIVVTVFGDILEYPLRPLLRSHARDPMNREREPPRRRDGNDD